MLPTLYKYFPINENLLATLNKSQLWFSDPITFNDPYDCNLDVYLEMDFDLMLKHFTDINNHFRKKGHRYLEEIDLKARVNYLFINPEEIKKFSRQTIRSRIESYGVCCFSKKENNLLLWSHYADKHSGVCLKFDVNRDKDFFYNPYEVQYPAKYPVFNYFRKTDRTLEGKISGLAQHLLATKSKDWEYEEEVRVVRDGLDGAYRGLIDIRKDALVEVIFGYKTTDLNINLVKNILRENDYSVLTFKMHLLETSFGLAKKPI